VNPVQHILVFAIRAYRWTISPAQLFFFGANGGCRFTPTCSQYAVESIRTHGSVAGSVLAVKRICRCHPWGACGHDPVPQGKFKIENSKLKLAEFVR
jgi:putative membrane protein insertion efficiency factor